MSTPEQGKGFAETVTQQHPGGDPKARREVGTAASSRLHPPHFDENTEEGEVDVPSLPANASGKDRVTTGEHAQPIDDESMYDRRTSQDKDQPPSGNAG